MKMNRIESFLMNNPVRAIIQRHFEVPLLERLGGRVEGLKVLEIGCGQGVGTEQILERFAAGHVQAIDVDPLMIKRAQKRLAAYSAERLSLNLGDVCNLASDDNVYDAVFDFAILHHVPIWQNAVAEICRVLRPGGRFYFCEVTNHFLEKWFARNFLKHPQTNRFSAEELIAELERQGLSVATNWTIRGGGDYVFGVGYLK